MQTEGKMPRMTLHAAAFACTLPGVWATTASPAHNIKHTLTAQPHGKVPFPLAPFVTVPGSHPKLIFQPRGKVF